MKIAIANDHSAIQLKKEVLALVEELGHTYEDFGTNETASCDYPVFGARAARAVAEGRCDLGIVMCGTGIGISLAANKVKGIRCALCSEPYSAMMTRRHNNANMLAMGARVVGPELAKMIVETFLSEPFEGGRHQRRIDQIAAIERGESIE